jgi:hypothetical protein
LDVDSRDGSAERRGPGWVGRKREWQPSANGYSASRGKLDSDPFWLCPNEWPIAPGQSFARGSGSNCREDSSGQYELVGTGG